MPCSKKCLWWRAMWTDTGCVVITATSHQTNTHKWSREAQKMKSCLASMKKSFFCLQGWNVFITQNYQRKCSTFLCMHINAMFPKVCSTYATATCWTCYTTLNMTRQSVTASFHWICHTQVIKLCFHWMLNNETLSSVIMFTGCQVPSLASTHTVSVFSVPHSPSCTFT